MRITTCICKLSRAEWPFLLCMALSQSVDGLNKTKRVVAPSQGRGNPFCLRDWARTLIFLAFEFKLKHQFFLALKPTGFPTGTYTFRSPEFPVHRLEILRLCNLYNCKECNLFLIEISLYINITMGLHTQTHAHRPCWFYFSGWRWLINTI